MEDKPWNIFEANAAVPNRIPLLDKNIHTFSKPKFIGNNGKVNINQYNKPKSDAEWIDHGYEVLMYRVQKEKRGIYTCWVPNGEGIDAVDDGDHYKRMNLNGSSPQCHTVSWAYHNPGVIKSDDVSHLCANGFCCRPSHLCHEARMYQLTRRGCPGVLILNDFDDDVGNIVKYYTMCVHSPECKVSTELSFAAQIEQPADN